MQKSDWRFFTAVENYQKEGWGDWRFYAIRSTGLGGYIFNLNGRTSRPDINPYCNLQDFVARTKNYRKTDLNSCLDLVKTIEGKDNVYRLLEISREPINISEEEIQDITGLLKKNRAFNSDSAYKFIGDKTLICYELERRNLIKRSCINNGNHFYLETCNNPKLTN